MNFFREVFACQPFSLRSATQIFVFPKLRCVCPSCNSYVHLSRNSDIFISPIIQICPSVPQLRYVHPSHNSDTSICPVTQIRCNLALHTQHGKCFVTRAKSLFTIVLHSAQLGHQSISSLYCDLLQLLNIILVIEIRDLNKLCEINI